MCSNSKIEAFIQNFMTAVEPVLSAPDVLLTILNNGEVIRLTPMVEGFLIDTANLLVLVSSCLHGG